MLVIGATPAGIAATNKLGEIGIPVTLVERDTNLDSKLSRDEWMLPSGIRLNYAHRPGLIRIMRNPSINVVMPADVRSIKHSPQGFSVKIKRNPTYINAEFCTLCGRCEDVCPVTLPDGTRAIQFNGRQSLPGMPVVDKRNMPLCQANCPLGVNVQGYITLAAEGKYCEALDLIRENNVLAGICGRVCTHPCEVLCKRNELDEPIAIREIKRFIADHGEVTEPAGEPPKRNTKFSVAVIGSGPAGIAAAAELARNGCSVTVYEKESSPGGLLRYGIGSYRLPPEILDRDIQYVASLGIEFVCNSPVDLKNGLSELTGNNDAVILATGTWRDRPLGIPGENLEGVDGCLSLLYRFYNSEITEMREKVCVIGDGNSTFDLSRVLVRLGADVSVLSWFPDDMIPADPEEVSAAVEEGVTIISSVQVVEFAGDGGKLDTLHCVPTIPGEKDTNGIPWPVPDPAGKPFTIQCNRAVIAIGQTGALVREQVDEALGLSHEGLVLVNPAQKTGVSGLFAAGDVVSGPSSVVEAMASGRDAARAVMAKLKIEHAACHRTARPQNRDFPAIDSDTPRAPRAVPREMDTDVRTLSFCEVKSGLTESQIHEEAGRCLQCGVCSNCLQCVEACSSIGAINHADAEEDITENAGVIIIADQAEASYIKGEDVIRAYDAKSSRSDVNSLIVRGFAAAAKALILLKDSSHRLKGHGISFSPPDPGLSPDVRLGIFVCRCNDSLGWMDKMTSLVEATTAHDDVAHAELLPAACVPDGYQHILSTIRRKGITRVVLASCVCCSLNFICSSCTDQRSRLKTALFTGTGVSRSMVEPCNVRGEALRYIQYSPEEAVKRFSALLDSSIRRARRLMLLPSPARDYNFATAVIGDTEAVINSVKVLAESGLEVFWFIKYAGADTELAEHPNIHIFEKSTVKAVSGTLGNFQVIYNYHDSTQTIQAGTIIMGKREKKEIPFIPQEEMPERHIKSSTQISGVTGIPFLYPGMTTLPGLYIADMPGIILSGREKGAATAMLAASRVPRGPRSSRGFTVSIDENLCRGCGRCIQYCPYQAIRFEKNPVGGWHAFVDDVLCKGCGNCISVCPSNAADSPYRNHIFLEKAIEELLV